MKRYRLLAWMFFILWTDRVLVDTGTKPDHFPQNAWMFISQVLVFVLVCFVVEALRWLWRYVSQYRIVRPQEPRRGA